MGGLQHELRELPGSACTDEDFARRERNTVFHRNWVHVADGHDLPQPGAAFPTVLAGLPIVLTPWGAVPGATAGATPAPAG